MQLGSEFASGVGSGLALGSESDGSAAGVELGDECDGASAGDPHHTEARPLASSSTDVELGVEFDSASAVASSDAQAAKVQAGGKRRPRGGIGRRTKRACSTVEVGVVLTSCSATASSDVIPARVQARRPRGESARSTARYAETRVVARSMAEQFEWAYAAMCELATRFGETAHRRLACRNW